MERDWIRQQPFCKLGIKDIREILLPAGLAITKVEPIAEGLANSNYRIQTDDGNQIVLRICQAGLASKPLLIAVSRRLGSVLPVPRVLEELPETPYLVFGWLPGQTMQSLQASENFDEILRAAFSIGQALGKLSGRKYNVCGFIGPKLKVVEPWGNLYEAFYQHTRKSARDAYLKGRLSLDHLMDIDGCWRQNQPALQAIMDRPCLSHGDFKASNLLIQNGVLSGILDWDFVHAGTWLLDAGQVLRYLGEHRGAFAKPFREGLTSQGLEVPADWENLARTVDLMNLVDFLVRPKISKAQISQITQLIDESIKVLLK